jgi:uncharacterized protein (UPF0333 family)
MRNKNKKSQIATEYLIMIGLILTIIIVTVAYTLRPQQESKLSETEKSISSIISTANDVMSLGAGNKIMTKIEIPSGISNIHVNNNALIFEMFNESEKITNISKLTTTKITGFFDNINNVKPGTYDLVFEAYGDGVCIYTPNNRSDYCICFSDDSSVISNLEVNISYQNINCTINNEKTNICNSTELDLKYGDVITKFYAFCEAKGGNDFDGYALFSVTNRKNEIVYEGISYKQENGIIVLEDDFVIENSGQLNITASCYQKCAYFKSNSESLNLIAHNKTISYIPFGEIKPFLLDKNGRKIYRELSNPYLINPENSNKPHFEEGWVKSGDNFVIRVGYECSGGECLNVNSSLWHDGTE